MTLSHYRHGNGDVGIIAAHSWVASPVAFAPLLEHLDTDKYSWVFPTFEGYGDAPTAISHVDIAGMGRELVGVADELGWSTFHLIGHSMGGQAAQAAVANDAVAQRVTSLTLVSSVPKTGFPVDGDTRTFFEGAAADPQIMAQVIHMLARGGEEDQLLANYISVLSRATSDPSTLAAYLRAWTQDDVSEGVDNYKGPVLVISGQDDPALGPEVAEQIARTFSNSKTEIIAGSGHFPPLEKPALLARLIASHVSAAEGQAVTERVSR